MFLIQKQLVWFGQVRWRKFFLLYEACASQSTWICYLRLSNGSIYMHFNKAYCESFLAHWIKVKLQSLWVAWNKRTWGYLWFTIFSNNRKCINAFYISGPKLTDWGRLMYMYTPQFTSTHPWTGIGLPIRNTNVKERVLQNTSTLVYRIQSIHCLWMDDIQALVLPEYCFVVQSLGILHPYNPFSKQ